VNKSAKVVLARIARRRNPLLAARDREKNSR
jgi:hypothetical protein